MEDCSQNFFIVRQPASGSQFDLCKCWSGFRMKKLYDNKVEFTVYFDNNLRSVTTETTVDQANEDLAIILKIRPGQCHG